MLGILDAFRRRRARRQPFPEAWRDIARADLPFYEAFEDDERARFETRLKTFALTKVFIGAGGMEITDRVKVVIAGAAARLVMNLRGEPYARLTEVVVYPGDYVHPDRDGVILGEAHAWGTMVLSWDATLDGLRNERDGHNTALHEFAHVLDRADGSFDGTPPLRLSAYGPWVAAMEPAFLALRKRRKVRKRQVLRRYGATNEAEFFAVATEAFFEKPRQLRERQPELYAVLADYYQTDLAAR